MKRSNIPGVSISLKVCLSLVTSTDDGGGEEKEREDREKKLTQREDIMEMGCSYKIRDSGILLLEFFTNKITNK
jgi:hypothetical protein